MLKYEAVAQDLADKIQAGTYQPNEKLPTTPELCEKYEVSKITIKKAMDLLEQRGLIARRRGSGTYIKGLVPAKNRDSHAFSMSFQMTGFTTGHQDATHKVTSKVYDFSVVRPPDFIAEELGMAPDEFAYHVVRVRLLNEVPQVIEYTYMPIKVIPDLREYHLEHSIYAYIQKDLGLKIASAHRIIQAVLVTNEEAKQLDVEKGSPALQVQQVGFLDDGRPFEYSVSRHVRNYQFYSISTA